MTEDRLPWGLDERFDLSVTRAEAMTLQAALRDHVRAFTAHAAEDGFSSHPPEQVAHRRTAAGRLIWRLEELTAGGAVVRHSEDAVPPEV